MQQQHPSAWLDSFENGQYQASWRFDLPVGVLEARVPDQVVAALDEVEKATQRGLYAVGFVAYEAAHALNPHLPPLLPQAGLPLVWFCLFRERRPAAAAKGLPKPSRSALRLEPSRSQADYLQAVTAIHQAIERGETYQINYTFPLDGIWRGDPLQVYRSLLDRQRPAFGALLETGSHTIISASPELFFSLRNGVIVTRPMKGTAPRGRFSAEDLTLADQLRQSPKERAENLMIVDLLRNDLGRIAVTGSVRAERLFEVASYPTVHQMTSTISARLQPETELVDIFRALFPCGSVTGAPKRRSMEIIAQLEQQPRGIYCGAIGYLAPEGECCFSVAIRTLLLDHGTGRTSMGVGSGITWGSEPMAEYVECLTKAAFLQQEDQSGLLESLLQVDGGYPLLEQHLERLCWSAGRLGYACDRQRIRQQLLEHAACENGSQKTRLLLAADGGFQINSSALQPLQEPLRIAVSAQPVDPNDPVLYLKTEQRERYEKARQEHPDADEVLLCNRQGELTEGSFTNLVLNLDGTLLTPPLTCGLLPGVLRQQLLAQGTISEQVLCPADLLRADEIWLINSVRGWLKGELLPATLNRLSAVQ